MRIAEQKVTRANASRVKQEVLAAARQGDAQLDWSAVTGVDSSSVAIVLAWIRVLQAGGITPQLGGVPDKMISLMRLYGTYELIEPFLTGRSGPQESSPA